MEIEKPNFYTCNVCGNMVGLIKNKGGQLVCCNVPMKKLEPNTVDASHEKHVPVYEYKDNQLTVKIGEVEHPMSEEHHIEWICIMQNNKVQRKSLNINEKPTAVFYVDDIKDLEIYCYCNLHGLWMSKA